jgi:RNA polymerase sigma-70 factor (ECF subfamily)
MFSPSPGGAAAQRSRQPNIAATDAIEIGALYTEYLEKVFDYVFCRVPNRGEAEDITAETFEAAAVSLPKFRGESTLLSWLLGIARGKIAEATRRRSRHQGHELLNVELTDEERETLGLLLASDTTELPEEAVLHDEAVRMMGQLMARLPVDQREALLLQVVDDLPIREIARLMGRSLGATNSLLQRARAAIYRHGREYFKG